jgi:hypothetical protein
MTRTIKIADQIGVIPDGSPLSPVRCAELPIELEQLNNVMVRVRPRVTFDSDPAGFLVEQRIAADRAV